MTEEAPFARPTSALLCGTPGALLDWVALAMAQANPGGYFWTDVRMPGQLVDPDDPLALGRIPDDRLHTVPPERLTANDVPANAAVSAVVRSEGPRGQIEHLLDFTRLPTHTQELLASEPGRTVRPVLLVLSNGHRISGQYPVDAVNPLVQAIVRSGFSLLVVYPDEPPVGRAGFDHVWHVRVDPRVGWKNAVMTVEKAAPRATYAPGARPPVREIPGVAELLGDRW